jgi:triacylglycerol lipase
MWAVAFLLLLALAIAATVLVVRRQLAARKRRKRRKPEPRLKHPVVLAHGVLGFDKIAIGGRDLSYFRGVTRHLTSVGAEVHRPRVHLAASIAVRAAELKRLIEMIPAQKVNVIAHSMGGLDARYAISKLGLGDRIATLTTVGTPHRGTPVADLGTKLGDLLKLRTLIGKLVDVDGFHDLTTHRLIDFNRDVPDSPKVFYGSVIGRIERAKATPLLWITHKYLTERAGANDGMVPAASQSWGEVLKEVEADHWAQIGWSSGGGADFDPLVLYEELLRELRGRGF